jgi:hypothetical protein
MCSGELANPCSATAPATKPLPVSDRFYSELSIDFIMNLPAKRKKKPRVLMVITNRLLKSCMLEAITFIKAENCAKIFV